MNPGISKLIVALAIFATGILMSACGATDIPTEPPLAPAPTSYTRPIAQQTAKAVYYATATATAGVAVQRTATATVPLPYNEVRHFWDGSQASVGPLPTYGASLLEVTAGKDQECLVQIDLGKLKSMKEGPFRLSPKTDLRVANYSGAPADCTLAFK